MPPAAAKAMTLRLPAEQAEALEAVAEVDGKPISEVVREAIAEHIEARRADRDFQRKLREKLRRSERILKRLGR